MLVISGATPESEVEKDFPYGELVATSLLLLLLLLLLVEVLVVS